MTQPTPEGVIPYVDVHDGPKRLATVTLHAPGGTPFAGMTQAALKPNFFVDGRQYIVYWGQVTFELPADRSVHLAVGMQDGLRGASMLLPPGQQSVSLVYHVPVTGEASLGHG